MDSSRHRTVVGSGDGCIKVEVVYAEAQRQRVVLVTLPAGSTVGDAVKASGLYREFPALVPGTFKTGVFAKLVAIEKRLSDQDRVEIYRPLIADPKVTRKRRAVATRRSAVR